MQYNKRRFIGFGIVWFKTCNIIFKKWITRVGVIPPGHIPLKKNSWFQISEAWRYEWNRIDEHDFIIFIHR